MKFYSDRWFLTEDDIRTEFGTISPAVEYQEYFTKAIEGELMNNISAICDYFTTNNRGVHSVNISKSSVDSLFNTYVHSTDLNWLRGYSGYENALPEIQRVIFNDPATIVFWSDGTKTVVKKQKDDKKKKFDKEKGLAMAIAKKALGNQGNYFETFKKWCD